MLLALATPKLCDRFSLARTSPFPLCKERLPAVGPRVPTARTPPALLTRGDAPLAGPPSLQPPARIHFPHWESGVAWQSWDRGPQPTWPQAPALCSLPFVPAAQT